MYKAKYYLNKRVMICTNTNHIVKGKNFRKEKTISFKVHSLLNKILNIIVIIYLFNYIFRININLCIELYSNLHCNIKNQEI